MLVLTGLGGMGKSHLARHLAVDRHGLVLEVDLRGHAAIGEPARPRDVAAAVLDHLGVPPGDDPLGRLQDAAARTGLVLLLDDARDADQIAPLLPREPGWEVVVTARSVLNLPHARTLVVGPVAPGAITTLLRASSGRDGRRGAPAAEDEGWSELASATGGVPLAAELLGSRLRSLLGWTPGDLAQAVRATVPDDLRTVVTDSLSELGPQDRTVLQRLCLHPVRRVPVGAAAALCDLPASTVRDCLLRLADRHLLDPTERPDVWQLHDLVWHVGLSRLREDERPGDLSAAVSRLLAHYVRETCAAVVVAHPMARAALPWWDGPDVLGLSAPEASERLTATVGAAQGALSLAGPDDALLTMHLAEALVWHLVTQSSSTAMLDVGLVARDAAARAGDLSDRARVERLMGNAYARLSRPDDAELSWRASRELAAAAGDVEAEIAAVASLARAASARGDQDRATELLEIARDHYSRVGDGARESLCLTNLVVTHTRAGRMDAAADLAVEAAGTARSRGWLSRELMATSNGVVPLLAVGRVSTAEAFVAREVELAAELDDVVTAVYAVLHRAMVARASGDVSSARRLAREALERNVVVEDAAQRAQILGECGELAAADGDGREATRLHEEALTLALAIGESAEADRAREALDTLRGRPD